MYNMHRNESFDGNLIASNIIDITVNVYDFSAGFFTRILVHPKRLNSAISSSYKRYQ